MATRAFLVLGLVFGGAVFPLVAGGAGFDGGVSLVDYGRAAENWPTVMRGAWVRVRGVAEAGDAVARDLEALRVLRGRGVQVCVILQWGPASWSGVRSGGGVGNRAPMDLGEAYARARALAVAYRGEVDAWEIENEPDIDFFANPADVFASYYKAMYWGLKAGDLGAGVVMAAPGLPPGPHFEQLIANGILSHTDAINYHHYGFTRDYAGVYRQFRDAVEGGREFSGESDTRSGSCARPSFLAPEFSFSAFRFPLFGCSVPARRLPVMLTEWGYSLLDGYDAQTTAGRVRQWAHFRSVAEWNARHGVGAPMAFVGRSYFEGGAKEFGLAMPPAEARAAHYGYRVDGWARRDGASGAAGGDVTARHAGDAPGRVQGAASDIAWDAGSGGGVSSVARLRVTAPSFSSGGVVFSPDDFGHARPTEWMSLIGAPMWGGEASPALAWLLTHEGGRGPVRQNPRLIGVAGGRRAAEPDGRWRVMAEAPSPVVLDVLAGGEAVPVKSYNGYWLRGPVSDGLRGATGILRIYNFGAQSADVRLLWSEAIKPLAEDGAERLSLAPGEKREIAVRLRAGASDFSATEACLTAEVLCEGARTRSRWASRFYPWPAGMVATEQRNFSDLDAVSANAVAKASEWAAGNELGAAGLVEARTHRNREFLQQRPLAPEEPPVRGAAGTSWLVTEGVRVERITGGWRFIVDHFPGVGLRPAVAELPLPEDWRFSPGETLAYAYRLAYPEGAAPLSAGDADARRRLQTGGWGAMAESYIRTTNGNLYSTVPRLMPAPEWKRYNQNTETLTMHFLGRAELPWRFLDNRPAALVFFIRPAKLPAIFEVRDAHVARWVWGEGAKNG